MLSLLLVATLSLASAQSGARQQIQTYLSQIYAQSNFSALNDQQLFDFYDSLTFYYQNYPRSPTWDKKYPNGRRESHPYAGTTCDCL
jgi:hypothetical protein